MEKVDWAYLVASLKAKGLTQAQIAESCECVQSTVSDMAKGRTEDPRHRIAARLLALAKKHRISHAPRP